MPYPCELLCNLGGDLIELRPKLSRGKLQKGAGVGVSIRAPKLHGDIEEVCLGERHFHGVCLHLSEQGLFNVTEPVHKSEIVRGLHLSCPLLNLTRTA